MVAIRKDYAADGAGILFGLWFYNDAAPTALGMPPKAMTAECCRPRPLQCPDGCKLRPIR